MNQKNIALTLYCPDIPILILWGNSCNIFLVIGGVNWTQPFEMLKSLRPSLPLTAFHCVGVFGPLQCAHGPREVKCFLKALTNSFQKYHYGGGLWIDSIIFHSSKTYPCQALSCWCFADSRFPICLPEVHWINVLREIMVGGQKIFSGGEVGFNKIVFGFLLNLPPAANQNSIWKKLL